jgi:hypothetical protein
LCVGAEGCYFVGGNEVGEYGYLALLDCGVGGFGKEGVVGVVVGVVIVVIVVIAGTSIDVGGGDGGEAKSS